jgi:hypothetical protein
MPKMHARKRRIVELKEQLGVKHADAIALLDHPDADERDTLAEYIQTYVGIDTYKDAVAYLEQERNDLRNQVMCERCGWTFGMVCPECPGCGCYNGRCSGWRHHEYADDDDEPKNSGCPECGAGGAGDPYGACDCYDGDPYGQFEDEPTGTEAPA